MHVPQNLEFVRRCHFRFLQSTERAKEDVKLALQALNTHLLPRTYLVGERITLADIGVACTLLQLYQYVLDTNFRLVPCCRQVCLRKLYVIPFLCNCITFTEDQKQLVAWYLFVFVLSPSTPVGGLARDKQEYCATMWFRSLVNGRLPVCFVVCTHVTS
jgi:glutathione S-transferase